MSFQKAVKTKAKLRLALCAPAGCGKTFTALKVASEISKLIRAAGLGEGRIAVIDTERGSASLYADRFSFDVCELESFSPLAYVEKIKEAESAGYDIIIPDSLSHAWAGKDGALEQKDQAADRGGNSFTAWRTITPRHNALVESIVGSRSHVIATMRTKMEYVQEVNNGKTEIKRVGLGVVQREGIEYEFTVVGDIDYSHTLKITKTRCDGYINLNEQFEKPGETFAKKVWGWLMNGVDRVEPPRPAPSQLDTALDEAFRAWLDKLSKATTMAELDAAAAGEGKPAKGSKEYDRGIREYNAAKARVTASAQGAA